MSGKLTTFNELHVHNADSAPPTTAASGVKVKPAGPRSCVEVHRPASRSCPAGGRTGSFCAVAWLVRTSKNLLIWHTFWKTKENSLRVPTKSVDKISQIFFRVQEQVSKSNLQNFFLPKSYLSSEQFKAYSFEVFLSKIYTSRKLDRKTSARHRWQICCLTKPVYRDFILKSITTKPKSIVGKQMKIYRSNTLNLNHSTARRIPGFRRNLHYLSWVFCGQRKFSGTWLCAKMLEAIAAFTRLFHCRLFSKDGQIGWDSSWSDQGINAPTPFVCILSVGQFFLCKLKLNVLPEGISQEHSRQFLPTVRIES